MTTSHYWLAQWLDNNEISNDWEIDHVLNSTSGRRGLVNAMNEAAQNMRDGGAEGPNLTQLGESIVAGRKLDLSGVASCYAYECLRQSIDSTFKRVWHYFDQIVVEGISPQWMATDLKNIDGEHAYLMFGKLRDQARLLVYLREIGADQYLIFSHKSHAFCEEHWMQHARELGVAAAFDDSEHDKTVAKILKSSEFTIREVDPTTWHATVTGKYFSEPVQNVYYASKDGSRKAPTPEAIVCGLISSYATAMVSDVSLARRLTLPLVEPVSLPWMSDGSQSSIKAKDADVAVRVGLPVFDDLTTRDFLKIREDERPDFEVFRGALRTAIRDQLTHEGSRSPGAIAKSIEDDYLRPGLADIERRLRNSRRALVKKTAVNLSIGTAMTAIGAISAVPLLVVGGIAALGSAVPLAPIVHKYIDDNDSIKMSDLYFLWRVEKQAKHR